MFQSDVFQADAFYTGGDPGPAPNPGITGFDISLMEAIAGYALAGATRSGDYGAYTNRLIVQVGGKEFVPAVVGGVFHPAYPIRGLIWQGTIHLQDALNEQADTGTFMTHHGFRPRSGETFIIGIGTIGGGRLFGGRVQSVGDDQYQQHLFEINVIDWTPDLDQKKVFGEWSSVGADIIFREILRDYCPGFSAMNVMLDAPSIPSLIANGEYPSALFQQIADYIGAGWKVDAWRDVHLKYEEAQQAAPLNTGHFHFDELKWKENIAQVRTVVWGIGGGGALATDYTVPSTGSIILPMDSVVKYRVGQWVTIGSKIHEVLGVNTSTKGLTISTDMVQPIGATPVFTGVRPVKYDQATPVNIIVRRKNQAAIDRMKGILSAVGIPHTGEIEHLVSDGTRNEDGIIALADANLARFAFPSVSGNYITLTDAKSGQFVQATYPHRKLWGRFQVQGVVTTLTMAPDVVTRNVTFSDTLALRFNDLIRAAARARKDR